MTFRILILLALAALSGCVSQSRMAVQRWYTHELPMYLPMTETPLHWHLALEDMNGIESTLSDQYIRIGRVGFNGGPQYYKPPVFYRYGKELGADLIIYGIEKTGEKVVSGSYTINQNVGSSTVKDSSGLIIGTVEHTEPVDVPYSYTVSRYDYEIRYYALKEDHDEIPWWSLKESDVDFHPTGRGKFDGIWGNTDYFLAIRTSAQTGATLGFVREVQPTKRAQIQKDLRKEKGLLVPFSAAHDLWSSGTFKMLINPKKMTGMWLMADKSPRLCSWSLDGNGFLQGDCAGGGFQVALRKFR